MQLFDLVELAPAPEDAAIAQATFEAFLNQQDIGWDQAVRGRISILWGKANALYIRARALHNDPELDEQ